MSNILKRTLGIVMAVVMIFAFLPMVNGQKAYADTEITRLDFVLDEEALDLNTAWLEREIYDKLKATTHSQIGVTTTGVRIWNRFVDYIDQYGMPATLESSENYVSTDKQYLLNYVISLEGGYKWPDSIMGLPEFQPASVFPEFEVYVNGVKRTDFYITTWSHQRYIDVYIPLEVASPVPIVREVTIGENDMSLEAGSSYTFTGEVTGTVEDKSIIWSVEGAESSLTGITSEGVLTIGEDETAETLTVTAAAAADPTKTDSVTITVLSEAPYIESVEINPSQAVVIAGKSQQFEAIVEGTQTDRSVTWSITGQNASGTRITEDGLLVVASDETAEEITVRTVANKDSTKYAEAVVTIRQMTEITRLDFVLDVEPLDLSPLSKESAVYDKLKATTYSQIGVTTTGVRIWNRFVDYIDQNGKPVTLEISEDYVSTDKQYLLNYAISLEDGYKWPGSIIGLPEFQPASAFPELEVYVNGEKCTDFYITTWSHQRYIDVYIPIDVKIIIGWHNIDGSWYYFNADGTKATGWKRVSKKWYYMDESGVMQTGWQKISGKWYYFNASGVMLTGWQKISNKWYYFNTSGEMLTGWQKISGKDYFFKSSGAMAANEWVKGYWWINKDGTWTYNYKGSWKKSGSKWWFGDTSGWYAKNTTITIDGKKYTFDAKGYMI